MKLQERSYSTKLLRPKPLIHVEDDGSLIVIATPWGSTDYAQRALDEVVKYINAAKADVEVTSPFEFLTCLTDEANYVRTSFMITNDILYRGENRSQYTAGVELLALFKRDSQIAWAQVGCPSVFLQRQGQRMQPLTVGLDLASELQTHEVKATIMSPLPTQLVGLEQSCNVQCGHTHVREGDQLVLLASSIIANSLWTRDSETQDLSLITRSMIQEDPDSPFWLGLVDI